MAAREHKQRYGWMSGLATAFDLLLYVLTFAVAVALILAYCAPYVNPNTVYWFAFFGLAAPFIYIANALLMLYWTVRWRSIAWLSLAVFVLGLGNVGKYFRPQWGKTYEQPREEGTIRILSYNVGGFWGNTVGKPESKMRAIAEYIRAEDPDVVCMQEYEVNYINRRAVLDSLLEPLKYKAVYFAQTIRDNGGWGIAVYSKYPIVGKDHMVFPESQNSAM